MGDEPVTPESPALVWQMYSGLTEQCQHFNTLESSYRTLASTWLLAAFGGIGFLLKEAPPGIPKS